MGITMLLKLIWYTINGTLSYVWLKNRIVMDSYLSGKWIGTFQHEDFNGVIIDGLITKCVLVVSDRDGKSSSAYLYYELHDIRRESILAKGFDELLSYKSYWNFVFKKKWNPKFRRLFHKPDEGSNKEHTIYDFDCNVINIFFKPRMSVSVKIGKNRRLVGNLEKD